MPYAIAVERPESDAPFPKAENYMGWYQWAKKNAPFTSATMDEMADYVLSLNHPTTGNERKVMSTSGTLTPQSITRLLSLKHKLPPQKILNVFQFAADNGYPVSFTPTDETVSQYLAKTAS